MRLEISTHHLGGMASAPRRGPDLQETEPGAPENDPDGVDLSQSADPFEGRQRTMVAAASGVVALTSLALGGGLGGSVLLALAPFGLVAAHRGLSQYRAGQQSERQAQRQIDQGQLQGPDRSNYEIVHTYQKEQSKALSLMLKGLGVVGVALSPTSILLGLAGVVSGGSSVLVQEPGSAPPPNPLKDRKWVESPSRDSEDPDAELFEVKSLPVDDYLAKAVAHQKAWNDTEDLSQPPKSPSPSQVDAIRRAERIAIEVRRPTNPRNWKERILGRESRPPEVWLIKTEEQT